VQWHTYTDRDGLVITYQVRLACTRDGCDGRTFRPVTPDARNTLRQRGPKGTRPLYRLPQLLAEAAAGAPVIVCEGESDTDAAAAAGWAATTMGPADHGTGSTWKPEHTAVVVEAAAGSVVTVAADRDTGAGRRSARYIAEQLLATGARVRVVEAVAGKDVRDHLAAGHTLAELRDVTDAVLDPAHDDQGQGETGHALAPVVPIRGGNGGGTGGPPSGGGPGAGVPRPEPFGTKVPSTGRRDIYAVTTDDPAHPRGLYIDGEHVSEIPYVLGRLANRDAEDRRKGQTYLLAASPDGPPRAISGQALSRGEYIETLGVKVPEDRGIKDAAVTVIRSLARDLPEGEVYARWDGDRFILPPPEVLPHGYGITADVDQGEARETWQEITSLAGMPGMENTAIHLGAAQASLYIDALSTVRPVSFALVSVGPPSCGKTTNENTAAAVFGPPIRVNPVISESHISMGDTLAGFGALPLFRDEIHASPMSPGEWKQLFMKNLNGAGRRRSSSDGSGIVRSTRGWWGAMFLSGNKDPRFSSTDGILRRVIALDSPHVIDGPTARYLTEHLLPRCYGWPLRWFLDNPPTVADFRDDASRCTDDIVTAYTAEAGTEPSGVALMVAEILGLITAGAERFAALVGGDVDELRAATIRGALRVLGTLADTVADLPMTFDAQLLDVITSDRARNPQAWPTEAEYAEMRAGRDPLTHGAPNLSGALPIRDVHGIQTTHDGHGILAALAGETGWFTQATTGVDFPRGEALAELRRSGVLISTRGTGYQWSHKIGGERVRFYAFRVDTTPGANGPVGTAPPIGTGDTPPDLHGANGANGANGNPADPHVSAREDTPTGPEQPPLPEPTEPATDPAGAPAAGETTPAPPGPENGTQGRQDPRTRRTERTQERTAERDAFDQRARTAVAEGRLPRVLAALEGPYTPTLRGRRPFYAPELPGMVDAAWVVTGYAWQREYTGPALSLDRSGAWISGASSTTVTHGALEHSGAVPDVALPGYYLLEAYPWREDGMPSPLGSTHPPERVWVAHPTAQLLAHLAHEGRWPDATPLDSYTGVPVRLTAWVEWVRGIRADIIDEYGRDSEEYISVKRAYGMAMSMMLGTKDDSMRTEWRCKLRRPDWTHAIQSQASASLWRTADQARHVAPDQAPVALRNVDELVIPPGALASLTADRGKRRPVVTIDETGRTLGTYKVKAIEEWKGGAPE
jgi:hypothetical protein